MEPPRSTDNPEAIAVSPPPGHYLTHLAARLGARPDMPDWAEYLFFLSASIVFLLGILALLGYIYLDPVRERLYHSFLDRERIRAVMAAAGSWGPLLFILAEALQVITIFWPVPLEIAGGFLFGLPLGLLYSTLGLALGSMLAFWLGRWLGKNFVTRLVHPHTMKSIRRLMEREGTLTAFLVFLIPGVPKDFVSYFLGLTRMSLAFFLVVATLARFPGTLLLTLEGAQVYKGHYAITLGLAALYIGLAFLLYRHRVGLYEWVGRWHPEED